MGCDQAVAVIPIVRLSRPPESGTKSLLDRPKGQIATPAPGLGSSIGRVERADSTRDGGGGLM